MLLSSFNDLRGILMRSIISLVLVALSVNSGVSLAVDAKKIKIGFSMDTLKEERWQRDRDMFVAKAKELGADVLVQAANGNASMQISQAENLLTQNVDVLVVVPANAVTAAAIVDKAHKAGKKVISYDRLIKNADVDLYISFDNEEVGRMQAKYLVERAPKGNYVLIGGSPTDNNAKMFRDGQMQVLKPLVDKGDIKIVVDQWAKDWQASEALKHTENALTRTKNDVQAVVASNDGTAGGVIAALSQQKLAGKVLVSGMDADLAACQRVAEGSQAMTVYKPIKVISDKAAEMAVAVAKNETVKGDIRKVNNGKKDVDSILLKPIQVDKSNLDSTVIKDGFHKKDDVYKNVKKA
jgi:D-xylose transport system substrate-binding protein